MEDIIFISCIFGNNFKKVHLSPNKDKSFFFTNNPDIKNEIINKDWIYVYVNVPLINDILESSLQSKYIKFLIFLNDFPEFKKYKHIVYFDHKECINMNTINQIMILINNNLNKSLIIRQTPLIKNTIQDEVNAAMGQERYVKNMNITKKFINDNINNISPNVRICNTGLLIYININNIKELLNSVYNKCIEHKQPECQIYWSIFSQKYKNEIMEIEWTYIKNIIRSEP